MKISIGCDHGGYELKAEIVDLLKFLGHEVDDQGTSTADSVNYPDFADAVCNQVREHGAHRGILICGTGIGMSMVANRHRGIRAALCHELFTARMSREHNDANVLCLGARVVGPGLALAMVEKWLETEFAGGRHQTRITMFSE